MLLVTQYSTTTHSLVAQKVEPMAGIEPRSGNSERNLPLLLRLVNHQAGSTQEPGDHKAFVHSFVHTRFELNSLKSLHRRRVGIDRLIKQNESILPISQPWRQTSFLERRNYRRPDSQTWCVHARRRLQDFRQQGFRLVSVSPSATADDWSHGHDHNTKSLDHVVVAFVCPARRGSNFQP